MHSRALLFGTIILFSLSTAYPAASQDRPDRGNAPQKNTDNRGGNHGKPSGPQAKPNPGGGNARPQPGRPQPGRPNPGGGKPQPSRPQPSRPQPSRPNPGRPHNGRPSQGRPPQWGHRPTQRPSYSFRNNDRAYLHRYYQSRFGAINRANRPRFVIGGFFPYAYISYIQPLPPDVYGYLPPPPPGYAMGYYQGYVVVYDPITYFIANVIDILQ
ncbi:MAG TPA: hypothetical protein VMU57_00435 [Edaphobacter sp.]|uniref:hypothetical protein n=1 Tax=Edaphobacter sp. TaxID=1934404 RepID=UPI002C2E8AE4|nr:hypothetical protein [Edaphobacter sp.]HUZ93357.1 hypothetical protein [Edaphobacter sp.]